MDFIKKLLRINQNETFRNEWLLKTITSLPNGLRILDAGAGELRNKPLCRHLEYVSQDICQYEGSGDNKGLQTGKWDTSKIDIVSDITNIPEPNESFDLILCSEVFEHLPDPLKALDEFRRLLKPGGKVIITAPFGSLVHFAPYHYSTGFSKYWYEFHMKSREFEIIELTANGDWFDVLNQELVRLPSMAKTYKDWHWPLAYLFSSIALLYFASRNRRSQKATDIACFGWHCVAIKK